MSIVENCIDDLSKNCRLCMKFGKNVRSIFNDNHKKWATTDISKLIYDCTNIEVTVNDCTTGICLLCYKQVTSITNFRERCARANELFKKRCKQALKTETIGERTHVESQKECIPFVHLGEGYDVKQPDCLWTKDEINYGEISDFEIPSPDLMDELDDHEPIIDSSTHTQQIDEAALTEVVNEWEDESSKGPLPKARCKMKRLSKQSQNCLNDWPKLKKRDLIETKAYRGLCHLCGKEYQHLWVHLQSHSDVPTETCDVCGKGFRSKANLSLHILLHKDADMPCTVCGKKYRTKMRLKRHMRVHTQARPFVCNICQKRFYTKYNLEVHSRIHSGERPFLCSTKNCNERFAHSYALKHHIEKVHKQ